MKKAGFLIFILFFAFPIFGQSDFQFIKKSNKISFSFKLINNLVFIPVKVNGVELTFLLDSGVDKTILFGINKNSDLHFENIEKINIKGFGSNSTVEGLKSTNNLLEIKGVKSFSHSVYVVLGEEFNFSPFVGIPVNGIIGYTFFINNLVNIDYGNKMITIYNDNLKNRKLIDRKYTKTPIIIEKRKPYLNAQVVIQDLQIPVKLLIDIGNSDSVWLFENKNDKINVPNKNFKDYLGRGFSGDVFGQRSYVECFELAGFKLKKPIVAFPDSTAIHFLKFVPDRMGSVGGEVLKRFSLVFDYKNSCLYLKPNKMFKNPFMYNKSGIEITQSGMQVVNDLMDVKKNDIKTHTIFDLDNKKKNLKLSYDFKLKPIYTISSVRERSVAANSGLLEGDVLIKINDNVAYNYSLEEVNELLKTNNEKWMTFVVKRNEKTLTFKFKLVDIL